MQIIFLESIDSTQKYLKELIKKKSIFSPCAVVANRQTAGVGSRENSWSGLEGNLFLSFALKPSMLPDDLKLESSSIYFSYIFKEALSEFGSKAWLKWPNDLYVENKKVGGVITNIVNENIVCGIGLNLVAAPDKFGVIDIKIDREKLLQKYFENIEAKIAWKQVFSKFELEFHLNQKFFTHSNNLTISLRDALLQNDGSIISNGERIYSLR